MAQLATGIPDEMRNGDRHEICGSFSRHEMDNSNIMKLLEISAEHAETLSLAPK